LVTEAKPILRAGNVEDHIDRGAHILSELRLFFTPESGEETLPSVKSSDTKTGTYNQDCKDKPSSSKQLKILNNIVQKVTKLYRPLHQGSSIRILEIQPGSVSDPIACHFHYADLESSEVIYEVLSYVWGGKSSRWIGSKVEELRTAKIQCNGHDVKITHNLLNALQHVRSSTEPKLL
jgi:heterokaryon incompatibility protein (HET)